MSCGCNGSFQKNQTSKKVFQALLDKKLDARSEIGAGLFLLPAPEVGPMQYKKVFVHDLSYIDVQLRGIDCLAYRWLPYSYLNKTEVSKLSANPADCVFKKCSEDNECEDGSDNCLCMAGYCT